MMKLAERLINEKEYQRQKKKVISGKLFFFFFYHLSETGPECS